MNKTKYLISKEAKSESCLLGKASFLILVFLNWTLYNWFDRLIDGRVDGNKEWKRTCH